MKEKIDYRDYAKHIIEALPAGILLNTNGDKFNTMVIGWGLIGIVWRKPAFTVYVREGRYTKAMIDKTGEFTISAPLSGPSELINKVCGLQSGRDIDKVKEASLTLAEPEVINTPGIKEYPLTLECRVRYSQKQDPNAIPDDIKKLTYPQDVPETYPLANRDFHTVYSGEIVAAYIIR